MAQKKKKVSRQREYQKRKVAEGNCMICGQPRPKGSAVYCLTHLQDNRERSRRYYGGKPWTSGGLGRIPLEAKAK